MNILFKLVIFAAKMCPGHEYVSQQQVTMELSNDDDDDDGNEDSKKAIDLFTDKAAVLN